MQLQLWTKVLEQIETFRALSHTQTKQSCATKTIPAFPLPLPSTVLVTCIRHFFGVSTLYWEGEREELDHFSKDTVAKQFKTCGEKQRKFRVLDQCPKDFCP